MSGCCSDLNLLWNDDFEYTDTLASKGYTVISSVAASPVAGEGVNGSRGVQMNNGSGLGQLGTPVLTFPELCANRMAFGFGGYWTFPDALPGPGGFYFAEVRKGFTTINSFYRDEGDLVVFEGVSAVELVRVVDVFNVKAETEFYKIEVAGQINLTWGSAGAFGSSDGQLSIFIDGSPKVCLKNIGGMGSQFVADNNGWDNIAFGVHGEFDCAYVSNGWICGRGPQGEGGQENPDTNDRWGPASAGFGGPGGSFVLFDPLTPSLHTTRAPHLRSAGRPESPVLIPPGGAAPSFDECAGNGNAPTGSDPTDPQTMSGIVSPLVFLDLTLPDATVLRLAQDKLSTPAAKYRDGKILSIGPVAQTLSDHHGRMESTTVRVVFEDTANVFRGYAASATNRFLKNSTATIYVESDVARRAATAPLVLMTMIAKSFAPRSNKTFELELVDELSAKQSPISVDRQLPEFTVADIWPNATDNLLPIPVPIVYGQYSDDDKWVENPKRTPYGIMPVIGPVAVHHFGESRDWGLFLICLYASKQIDSVFASNLADSDIGSAEPQQSGSVRMDLDDTEGVDGEFLVPGRAGWTTLIGSQKYLDITGVDGTVYRVTAIYARRSRAEAHVEKETPITVNLCGIESTGDGTGTLIDQAAEVAWHFWNYVVVLGVTSGSWPSPPTDALGTNKVQRAGVTTLNALHLDRVATIGYQTAWTIRERRPVRAYWEQFQFGTGIRVGRNRHQIVLVDTDGEDPLSGLTKFDHSNITEGTFQLDPGSDEIVNRTTYVSGPEASTGRFSHGMRSHTDHQAITNYGETHEQPDVEIHTTRRRAVAADVVARKVFRLRNEVVYGSFDTDLQGIDLDLGQFISITHDEGLGVNGWIDNPVLVIGIVPNPQTLQVTIRFEDVNLTVGDPCVWDPMEDDASAPIIGDESDNTAARICSG